MAGDEACLAEAARMAIEEINQFGGVLGKQVEMVLRDGASSPAVFANSAQDLLTREGVRTIFGCWMSSARKAVKPVVEKYGALLWYPIQYEGLEESTNILYTGSCLNQQIEPAVRWGLAQGWTRCFLVGSDYVFPRTASSLIRALVEQEGGRVLGEHYLPLGSRNVNELTAAILESCPEIVFNTINGDSNQAFFREYQAVVGGASRCPIMSFSLAENSLGEMVDETAGHYACWSYFQGLASAENEQFVRKYQKRFGSGAIVNDPIVTAYTQVYLWKEAVERAGSFEPEEILRTIVGCRVTGPGGVMEIQANHHVKKAALIGRATSKGRFEIVWGSDHAIDPKPWLGVEDAGLATRSLVLEALKQYPEVIHRNVELDAHVRQRSAELERMNKALQAEIAERRQVEETLRRSETQARLLIESTAEAIYGLDLEGNCTFCNPACLEMLGYACADELLGKNMHQLMHHTRPDGSPYPIKECCIYEAFQRGKGTHVNEEVLWRADGTSFAAEYWSYPIHRDGQIIGAVVTFLNITQRKQAEKGWEELIAKLEVQNAELERFTYTVSHDLKTPLITIKGYLGVLEEDLPDGISENVCEDLSRISDAASRMDQLLNDLLALSRIGRLMAPPKEVPLANLARDVVESIRLQIEEKNVLVDIASDLPTVVGDELRLREVLQNLLDNSVKYLGDQPRPRIEIGSRLEGEETVCYVRDNGLGIAPCYHDQVFELFRRLDYKEEGTGIGLTLVKRIVEAHEGRIWIESKGEGHGTTFCFVLPANNASRATGAAVPPTQLA